VALVASTNIDLNEDAGTAAADGARRGAGSSTTALLLRTPAALMPQLDRGVGAELVSTRGDVVGKRDDFKVWRGCRILCIVPWRGMNAPL
jgi:hypothetical protein